MKVAAVELLGQAEQLAPAQREPGQCIVGRGHDIARFGSVARAQSATALALLHQLMHLLRAHRSVFLGTLQGSIEPGVSGVLAVGVLHSRSHLLGSVGHTGVLGQPWECHREGLGHVDHGRSHGPADVLRKQQPTEGLRFFARVLHVVHQSHGLVFELALRLGHFVGRVRHFTHVQV